MVPQLDFDSEVKTTLVCGFSVMSLMPILKVGCPWIELKKLFTFL